MNKIIIFVIYWRRVTIERARALSDGNVACNVLYTLSRNLKRQYLHMQKKQYHESIGAMLIDRTLLSNNYLGWPHKKFIQSS